MNEVTVEKALADFNDEMGSTLQIVYQTDIQSWKNRLWVCYFGCWHFMGLEDQGAAAKGIGHTMNQAILRCHKKYLAMKKRPQPNVPTTEEFEEMLKNFSYE